MKLFEPIKLGSLTLKNRLALAPMDTELSGLHGEVTRDMIAYYAARAAGGVGLIITEFTAVDGTHRLTSPSMYSDRFIAGWSTLVEKLHAFGTGVILQIAHHGGRALERITGTKPVAPSAVASPIYPEVPRELTRDEIEDLIAKFVRAAERAKAAGFDGVEIHAGHGYLIGEFVSPHTNRRTDEYGGSLENRLRFPVEILKGIRDSLGSDFVVGFKFSAYEGVEGGIDVQQAVDIARYMEAHGVDYLHVSVLSFPLPERRFPSVPPIYTPAPPLVELAAEVKRHVTVPVMAVGGIGAPEEAERILQEGSADIVVLGRALIADPALPRRWKRGEVYRPCIKCNRCHIRIMEQKPLRCAVNPAVGREGEPLDTTPRPKRIAVIGAGPAGITFAVTAARRGHEVHLFERRDRIGGKVIAGSRPSFKGPLRLLLEFWEREIADAGMDVRLGTAATPDSIGALSPDLVVLATGGRPRPLALGNAMDALMAFEHPDRVGKKVLIVGAGMVGCELALYLNRLEKEVMLVDVLTEDGLMVDEHYFNRYILLEMIKSSGVDFLPGVAVAAGEAGVVIDGTPVEVDTVVNATGFEPDPELVQEFREAFGTDRVLVIGDLKRPGNIYDAVQEAYLAATNI